jgi:hypothetical protein
MVVSFWNSAIGCGAARWAAAFPFDADPVK